MILNTLSLFQFRNLADCSLTFGPAVNLVFGENGQGKTNLLEAIWLCTGARSFRGSKMAELPRFGTTGCSIEAGIQKKEQALSLKLSLGQGRAYFKNRVLLQKKAEFAGNFICVAFSPAHLLLVSGPPEGRRSFLDATLCQSNHRYLDVLARYKRILLQKNALLHTEMKKGQKEALLEVYDQQLAPLACFLSRTRKDYVQQLADCAALLYDKISGERERLLVQYRPGSKSDTPEGFLAELKEARETDLRNGNSSHGPHKDELLFSLDGHSARSYASQGQKRSIVLACKLAEAELLQQQTGEQPVILLDDVLSELDGMRQDYLLNRISGRQIFISACEESKKELLSGGEKLLLQNGRITQSR